MEEFRSHLCGQVSSLDGTRVRLSGWVHSVRNHGDLLFIMLRDNSGVVQLVSNVNFADHEALSHLKSESVIRIDGLVRNRSLETINEKIATGKVEVLIEAFELLSVADPLPFPIQGEPDYPEEIRLKHRYLDLRRETLHDNILLRSDVIAHLRQEMMTQGFREFQTPILTASSPEGARDFVVPSRLHPGKFYALPQAPQQFKQLLMVAGFDRYFQIAPCFRDESARADRSPGEFYQLDIEMSFVNQEDVFAVIEPVLYSTFTTFRKNVTDSVSPYPFVRIPYREAIRKYGTDKPDLRNPFVFENVTDHFRGGSFPFFATMLEDPKKEVWGIAVPETSPGLCKKMDQWAKDQGRGLAYIRWADDTAGTYHKANGPVANKIGQENAWEIFKHFNLLDYAEPAVFFVAGDPDEFYKFAGLIRTKLSEEFVSHAQTIGVTKEHAAWAGMPKIDRFEFCWIVDFPMYELDDDGKVAFSHNPFSMPQGGMDALLNKDPLNILAYQYDIVCNGIELCSGAIRNHKPDIMLKAFEIAGYSSQEVEDKFGGMLNAFRYGAPPHGGLAPGIDRIVMLLAEAENIREIIAFPLNQQGMDLMMNAPNEIPEKHMKELNLRQLLKV